MSVDGEQMFLVPEQHRGRIINPGGWKWNVRKLLKMGNMITKSPSALIVDNKLRILGIACASSARTLNLSGKAGSEKKTDRTGRRYDGKVGKEICTSPCWG